MNVTKTAGKELTCDFCQPGALQAALDEVARDRSLKSDVKTQRRNAIKEDHRVVAVCDKPIVNEYPVYKECRTKMCERHIAAEPMSGIHWCSREHPVKATA